MYAFQLDLSRTHVFFDWDGTVSRRDTGVHLLERLATGDWATLDGHYAAGRIGSRECLVSQWALLPHDRALLSAVAAEVELDPAFLPLVERLRAAGARVSVVSDGFGFHVHERLAGTGIDVITNAVDWATGELGFPHAERCCPCTTCGTCKQAPIRDAAAGGWSTVFVGDGVSDRKAALLVDVLFAKDGLARWCDLNGVDFTIWRTLADVEAELFD